MLTFWFSVVICEHTVCFILNGHSFLSTSTTIVIMSQFIDIIEVGKEKSISNEKASQMLSSFINANSVNDNDTFDETKIVRVR